MNGEEPQAPKPQGVGIGVLIGIGLQFVLGGGLLLMLGIVGPDLAPIAIVCVGITQLVYMVPAMVLAHIKKQPGIVKGVAIITAITFLLNAGCFGLIALGSLSIH